MPAGRAQIDGARMIDFAPTVLSLLGVTPAGLEGRPLLDLSGQVIRGSQPGAPAPKPCAPDGVGSWHASTTMLLRRLPRVAVVLHPSLRRPASEKETAETSELPVLVAITLHAACVRREVVREDASYVEARSAMSLVAGRDETWMDVDGKRQVLKTGTQIPIGAAKRIRIRSRHSYDSIAIERSYVVVPLAIRLPRVPAWLRDAVDDMARAGRLLIDDCDSANRSILVGAADFERAVQLLDAQLGGESPSERLAASRLSDMARVNRALPILEGLLDRATVSRFDTTPGHRCAE
jgi:hypothetical protein